jgi:hypothetical protein
MAMESDKNPVVSGVGFDKIETYGDLLPQQYYDILAGPRRRDGARDLMLAVLEDAIRTYLANIEGRTTRQRRLFDEVKAWIGTRGDRAPFSFETICETFDIEANNLRRRLSSLPPEKFLRRRRTPKRSRMMELA